VRASPFSARAPACDTPATLPAASCAIRRRAINPDANLRAAIERVVISRTTIEIELAESAAEDNQNRILIIPLTPPSPYLRRQIIQGEGDQSSERDSLRLGSPLPLPHPHSHVSGPRGAAVASRTL
jgi:hypothetical protein